MTGGRPTLQQLGSAETLPGPGDVWPLQRTARPPLCWLGLVLRRPIWLPSTPALALGHQGQKTDALHWLHLLIGGQREIQATTRVPQHFHLPNAIHLPPCGHDQCT
jgi:hypothetical protein